jgi:hypothetical protein
MVTRVEQGIGFGLVKCADRDAADERASGEPYVIDANTL